MINFTLICDPTISRSNQNKLLFLDTFECLKSLLFCHYGNYRKKITAIGHGTPIDFFSSSDYEILCSPIKELQITKIHLHKYRVAQTGKY